MTAKGISTKSKSYYRIAPGALAAAFACLLAFAAVPILASPAPPKPQSSLVILRGTLSSVSGKNPVLTANGKEYTLAGQSSYILRTLQDKRLLNHELQVVGTQGPNGDFVVQRMYDIHNGKLYKIQYYCEVCNITYVQPGHCYCCGRETKLKEVPAN
ncbi:MAG TPA: hypothetical protein VFZ08_06225 [Terriglobia bacterium]|nr:hypothetical protein [Terriglobia bacterium]